MTTDSQEPISPPEAANSLPDVEGESAASQQPSESSMKIKLLENDFGLAKSAEEKSLSLLKVAKELKAGNTVNPDLAEYQALSQRLQNGEALENVIAETAQNAKDQHQATLKSELNYSLAQASSLRSQVGLPPTPQDIISATQAVASQVPVDSKDPALIEVNQQIKAGVSLSQIRASAENTLKEGEGESNNLDTAKQSEQTERKQLDKTLSRINDIQTELSSLTNSTFAFTITSKKSVKIKASWRRIFGLGQRATSRS